ncbi:MAG: T9SS type A sorting domain-containing protein [Bacteroidales bacterium]
MKIHFISTLFILLIISPLFSATIEIEPTGTDDDTDLIQNALDGLETGDTLILNGDFVFRYTIYLPSYFTWILNGTLMLAGDAVLDKVGWVDPPIDARRRTGITEKSGGATNIDMSGGTYYGNSDKYPYSMRLINFVSVTNSNFHDMLITDCTDDNFTLGPGSNNNECRNIISSFAGGNALTDKGDYNKWYDCIAEDCYGPNSDGWTPKCRNSEFHRCIARRNVGPGFGMYCRIDGSGDPVDLGESIDGNKFFECEAYENGGAGFSFNISSNSGAGATIKNNYIQAICYNNASSGVRFRNKTADGIVENNEIDILCYGNRGEKSDGTPSTVAGGLGTDGGSSYPPITGITGRMVSFDNVQYDVNTNNAFNCDITVYNPSGQHPAVLKKGDASNKITVINFNCSDELEHWCQQSYCSTIAVNASPTEAKSVCSLSHNFPNPFSESTWITYTIPAESRVSIKVYDPSGKELRTLVDEFKQQGQHMTVLNKRDLPGGTLVYRIIAGRHAETKKIIHIK